MDTGSFRCSQNSILFSEEKEEGSSSDWSSSDEDDDSDSTAINPLRPSTQSALHAQWCVCVCVCVCVCACELSLAHNRICG